MRRLLAPLALVAVLGCANTPDAQPDDGEPVSKTENTPLLEQEDPPAAPDTNEAVSDPATEGAVACGDKECGEGEVCCNPSCGICTPPGGMCIQKLCVDVPPIQCGAAICGKGQLCCDPEKGLCAQPGQKCAP